MKKTLFLLLMIICVFTLSNCKRSIRVYNDEDLTMMAKSDFGFTSVIFFKIVDPDTALELTGDSYNNSGVLYGIKDEQYTMLFVPKLISKEEFLLDYEPVYDVIEIYNIIKGLKDGSGNFLFRDRSNDYGGLSISISPYESISTKYSNIDFDCKIFFIITTDEMIFNVGSVNGRYIVFDQNYNLLN
jgi:hypothetical protein